MYLWYTTVIDRHFDYGSLEVEVREICVQKAGGLNPKINWNNVWKKQIYDVAKCLKALKGIHYPIFVANWYGSDDILWDSLIIWTIFMSLSANWLIVCLAPQPPLTYRIQQPHPVNKQESEPKLEK